MPGSVRAQAYTGAVAGLLVRPERSADTGTGTPETVAATASVAVPVEGSAVPW